MEQLKRQSSSSFNNYDDSKRQKLPKTTDETNCLSREMITYFEDLSNELIYEIFEFLDYFHVYEAFFNLNIRFYNLLINSKLPIKINISSMSKSTFKRYNTDIIQTNVHRISSLRFSEVFIYDLAFSSIGMLSKFCRVKTLILDNIESECLENLFDQLISLRLLSSLVITSADGVRNMTNICRQIFRLPALKYCKLDLSAWTKGDSMPVSINEHSSIEHLIMDNNIQLAQLDSLLSYLPQLRRLSICAGSFGNKQAKICPLLNLTHVFFKLHSISFDQFEQMVIDLFPRTVQVLNLMLPYKSDLAYLDADKWKQLILSHIPNLRIFDIQINRCAIDNNDQLTIETQINQFTSSFWIERQWFFAHHFDQGRMGKFLTFYSTNLYRKKNYTLYKQLDKNTSSHHSDFNLCSVQHVRIQSQKSIIDCMNYFPNVTELTFNDNFSSTRVSFVNILNRIIPLKQLTKLTIECRHFSFKKMTELLHFTPNIHTTVFKSIPLYKNDFMSIEQSETFQLVSTSNNIKDVTFTDECTLEKLKLVLGLCRRVQRLSINILTRDLEPIIQLLFDKTNPNTRHLRSLCFSILSNTRFGKFNTVIKSETLPDDYTLKWVPPKLYLWW